MILWHKHLKYLYHFTSQILIDIHHRVLEVLKMSNKRMFQDDDEKDIDTRKKSFQVFCLVAKCVLII